MNQTNNEIDKDKILEILRKVKDPELNANLVEYNLIKPEFIFIDHEKKEIQVLWVPTTPFCPLILYISAAIKYILEKNLSSWKVKVKLHPDVIGSDTWNKRLNNDAELNSIIGEIRNKGWLHYFIVGEIE